MRNGRRLFAGALLAGLMLLSACAPAAEETLPVTEPPATAAGPETPSVALGTAGLDRGVVELRCAGAAGETVKVQITREDGVDYHYDLQNDGSWTRFTLTEGDGTYRIRVLEHLEGENYTPIFTREVPLALADPLSPFLEPNQYVNYGADSAAVVLADRLTEGLEDGKDRAEAILEYVVDHVSYDEEKAERVKSRELTEDLPDVDAVLAGGRGICSDYAALTAAMLRSQGIPCKVAVGDVALAGGATQRHAWVEVWEEGAWIRRDPTFLSGAEDREAMAEFVAEDGNYCGKYYY